MHIAEALPFPCATCRTICSTCERLSNERNRELQASTSGLVPQHSCFGPYLKTALWELPNISTKPVAADGQQHQANARAGRCSCTECRDAVAESLDTGQGPDLSQLCLSVTGRTSGRMRS